MLGHLLPDGVRVALGGPRILRGARYFHEIHAPRSALPTKAECPGEWVTGFLKNSDWARTTCGADKRSYRNFMTPRVPAYIKLEHQASTVKALTRDGLRPVKTGQDSRVWVERFPPPQSTLRSEGQPDPRPRAWNMVRSVWTWWPGHRDFRGGVAPMVHGPSPCAQATFGGRIPSTLRLEEMPRTRGGPSGPPVCPQGRHQPEERHLLAVLRSQEARMCPLPQAGGRT